jgi:rhomboid protease GluP
MDNDINYAQHSEPELVEMFGRLDPRYAPAECTRLGKYLAERGYVVTQGETGPGSAEPSSVKLQQLIGSPRPFVCSVDFGKRPGADAYLEQTHNDFEFTGSGMIRTDGISVDLSGQVGPRRGRIPSLSQSQVRLPWRQIVNVEQQGSLVRFAYGGGAEDDGAVTLKAADEAAASALVAVLPKSKTDGFYPHIKSNAEFETRLIARSPKTPVTVGLIAINAALLMATLVIKGDWRILIGNAQIGWGSNFGPYTTDGDWWRLLTALFVHFGFLHLVFNMAALGVFGPLVERLYGSVNYLLIYVLAGVSGSLAGVAWHPDVNSGGASGAIVGVLGALLAAQWRTGDSFPSDLLRPIRHATLVFLGWVVYVSFTHTGVDYAAHLGGFASGFLLGLAAAQPITAESLSAGNQRRALLRMLSVAAVLVMGGYWWAERGAASLAGDGLYYRTVHSIHAREGLINGRYQSVRSRDANNRAALADTLEREVIPFWRKAGDRLSVITLLSDSPNRTRLENLQAAVERRSDTLQLLDDGLRQNDLTRITPAERELEHMDQQSLTAVSGPCCR